MNEPQLRALMEQVREGAIDVDAALGRLRHMPFEDLGFAKVDQHRAVRHGMPEVILGMGKTPQQVVAIAERLLENAKNVLIPRSGAATAEYVKARLPGAEYFPASSAIRFWGDRTIQGKGKIAVVCAGTSDIPVAEEAQITAEVMGNEVETIYDIGVAGVHLRIRKPEGLRAARGVVRCAGG